MSAVPAKSGFCLDRDGICYEWKLSADPAIRLIASGYEDGVEYGFYRRSKSGKYRHVVRVHPVLKDSARPASYYWGYPEDIEDIALIPGAKGLMVSATIDHSIVDDGEVYSPDWPKKVPAVLFVGHTTQPGMIVPILPFKAFTIQSLRSRAAR
jgi:hypothetical protein